MAQHSMAWPGNTSSAHPSLARPGPARKKLCTAILLVPGLNMVIPMGVTNHGGSFSSPHAWLQLGRLCPHCLTEGAGTQLLPQKHLLSNPSHLTPGRHIFAK